MDPRTVVVAGGLLAEGMSGHAWNWCAGRSAAAMVEAVRILLGMR